MKFAVAALGALLLVMATGTVAAEPLKLRVGWIVVPAEITPIFPKDPKIAQHDGRSYVIESMRFQGSSLYIQALAAGELDIAPFGYSSFGLAVANADLKDLKIIAAEDRDGYDGYFTTQYMVRKDSGIDKIEDLKGKVIATNAVGSISDMAFRIMVRRHHLNDAKDMSFVEASLPNMDALLLEKKVDLIPGVVPFTLNPTLQKDARTLFTGVDAIGPTEIAFMTARQRFLRKHRAAVVDFLDGLSARAALVPGPRQPPRRDADRRQFHEASRRQDLELGLHQGRLLPPAERARQRGDIAEKPRPAARGGFPQDADRREALCRYELHRGSGKAPEVTGAPHFRWLHRSTAMRA